MNSDINNTPYMQALNQMFPECINFLTSRGQITQMEAQKLMMDFPAIKGQYVSKLLQRYQNMMPDAFRNDIINNFIAKQLSYMRSSGQMYNGGMMMGNNGMMFSGVMNNGSNQLYSASVQPMQQQQMVPQQPIQQQIVVPPKQQSTPTILKAEQADEQWKKPEIDESFQKKTFESNDTSTMSINAKRYKRSNGRRHVEIIAIENSVRYTTPEEIFKMIQSIPDMFIGADSYTVSIGYLEPKLLEVGMKEVVALAEEFLKELGSDTGVLKRDNGVHNIGALRKILHKHSSGLCQEYFKFLIDLFNVHLNSGELCDANHLMPFPDIQELGAIECLASRTNIDKILSDIEATTDFDKSLAIVIEKTVMPYITNLKNYIIDPKTSISYLEAFCKTIPRFISRDGVGYAAVPDMMKLYATSKEHVNGSASGRAKQAKADFDLCVSELLARYTVVYHPRVVTFTNMDPGQAMRYGDLGVCPRYYSTAMNDVSYFLLNTLGTFAAMKNKLFNCSAFSARFENDELMTNVFYGIGTDQGLWTGNEKYLD